MAKQGTYQPVQVKTLPSTCLGLGLGLGRRRPGRRLRGRILEDMGRIIGTILGVILAIWLVFTAAGGILATLKTFLVVGLIVIAVFIVVWLLAGRSRRD
jgi:hypothetical protein